MDLGTMIKEVDKRMHYPDTDKDNEFQLKLAELEQQANEYDGHDTRSNAAKSKELYELQKNAYSEIRNIINDDETFFNIVKEFPILNSSIKEKNSAIQKTNPTFTQKLYTKFTRNDNKVNTQKTTAREENNKLYKLEYNIYLLERIYKTNENKGGKRKSNRRYKKGGYRKNNSSKKARRKSNRRV